MLRCNRLKNDYLALNVTYAAHVPTVRIIDTR
jgi:hypothetical protein